MTPNKTRPTIFIDLDGVIVDFTTPALRKHGVTIRDESGYPADCEWDILQACNKLRGRERRFNSNPLTAAEFWDAFDYDFWYGLPLYPGASTFVKNLEQWGDIYFATTPALSSDCVAGKYDWVKKHFPEYRSKLVICTHKEVLAGPNTILIDDRDKNCEAFEKAGGIAIPVPRPWNNFEQGPENLPLYDHIYKTILGICL
jgi:5'(3')-deoxyribonucleotidase